MSGDDWLECNDSASDTLCSSSSSPSPSSSLSPSSLTGMSPLITLSTGMYPLVAEPLELGCLACVTAKGSGSAGVL